MAANNFEDLDPLLRRFGEFLVTTMEDGLGKRLDKIEERLDGIEQRLDKNEERLNRIEQKLDFFISGSQWFMGKSLVVEALTLVVARSRPEEMKSITETWNRITAFNDLEAPPAVKESALQNYKDIKGFLEEAVS